MTKPKLVINEPQTLTELLDTIRGLNGEVTAKRLHALPLADIVGDTLVSTEAELLRDMAKLVIIAKVALDTAANLPTDEDSGLKATLVAVATIVIDRANWIGPYDPHHADYK